MAPRRPRWLTLPHAIWAHPFQVSLSLVLALMGARSLLGWEAVVVSRTVDAFPSTLTLLFYVAAVAGGLLTLAGMVLTARRASTSTEQLGLWISAGAWASYGIGVSDRSGVESALLISMAGALSLSCVIRAGALYRTQRDRLAGLALVRAEVENGDHRRG